MAEQLRNLPDGFRFHHIGYATASIEKERDVFESLGYRLEGAVFQDPIQGISGCFLAGGGPRVELLENLPGSDRLMPWLNAGVRMYHLAYEVGSTLEDALTWARGCRAKVNVAPVPAVAFRGRRIAFLTFRNGLMIELIETQPPAAR